MSSRWMPDEQFFALALDPDKRQVRAITSNVGHCLATGIIDEAHRAPVVGRMFAPDLFSGWGIRTLSSLHPYYNPLSYHRGTVWGVEQGTIIFGLRRFGFNARALDLTRAMFELARLYPEDRIPECVGGYPRGEYRTPGAYPRANTPQLWNATAFPLAMQSVLGLLPLAPLEMLVVDPILPTWMPDVIVRNLRVGRAVVSLEFRRAGWRIDVGRATQAGPVADCPPAAARVTGGGCHRSRPRAIGVDCMKLELLPLNEQVLVITGASSGIGLVTAKEAARRGASVVLAARNGGELAQAVQEIRHGGGRAIHITADVADPQQVETIAEAALRAFGRIDTWVNNAAVSMYGRILELSTEDMRRQMDINFWGQVYGSRTAVKYLRQRGGALINVGSALSDRAIPLQGIYCAAKHALKAFTDTLRMELEDEGAPVSVTLVKPASIDTPFFEKARTYLGVEPQPVPPVYAPEVVAGVILHASQHPLRELIAGGAGAKLSAARFAPRLADKYMERWTFDAQKTDMPAGPGRPDNLYGPVNGDGGERGHNWRGHTRGSSVYTSAMLRPATAAGIAAATVALAGAAWRIYGGRRKVARNPGELEFGLS